MLSFRRVALTALLANVPRSPFHTGLWNLSAHVLVRMNRSCKVYMWIWMQSVSELPFELTSQSPVGPPGGGGVSLKCIVRGWASLNPPHRRNFLPFRSRCKHFLKTPNMSGWIPEDEVTECEHQHTAVVQKMANKGNTGAVAVQSWYKRRRRRTWKWSWKWEIFVQKWVRPRDLVDKSVVVLLKNRVYWTPKATGTNRISLHHVLYITYRGALTIFSL